MTNDQPLAVEAASVGIPTISQHQLFRHNISKVLSQLTVCYKGTRALTLRIFVSSVHVYQGTTSETSSYEEKQRQKQESVRELEASLSNLSLERKANKVGRRIEAEQVVQRRLADVCGKEANASALLPHTSTLSGPQDTHYVSPSSWSGKVPFEMLAAEEHAQAAMLMIAPRYAATEAASAAVGDVGAVASIAARHAADAGTVGRGGGGISPWFPVTLPCGSRYWWNQETNETTDVGAAQPTTMYHRPHMAPLPAAILPPPSHPPPTTANDYLPGLHMAPLPAATLPPPSHPPPITANACLPAPASGHFREAAYQKPPQEPRLAHVLLPCTYYLN